MLRQKAIKKIFITTLTMFIILTVYTIPSFHLNDKSTLRTNLEIQDIMNLKTDTIYLLNQENYFVQTEVVIEENKLEDKIKVIMDYLTIDNDKIPIRLNGYIPKNVTLLNYFLSNTELYLNFSKEFLEIPDRDKVITGIVYSFLEQDRISFVSFQVEGKQLESYQKLTKEIGINKEYLFSSRKNIQKVVVYYLDSTSTYYVPVTKYMNNSKEKVEIIVEELKKTQKDLISLEDIHTELLDYKEQENVFFLNFNEYLLEDSLIDRDKLLHTIAFSIFDNYDVNMVMFEVNQEKIGYITR